MIRPGRPTKITPEVRAAIEEKIRDITVGSIRKTRKSLSLGGIRIGRETIRKAAVAAGLRSVRPQRKPALTIEHRNSRVQFADGHLEDDENLTRRRVYCDEKLFVMGRCSKNLWIPQYDRIPSRPTKKAPMKIMVFGAISWWGKTKLVRFPKGHKVTAVDYLDTIKRITLPQVRELFAGDSSDSDNDNSGGGNGFEWVQDNASVHTARVVTDWISEQPFKWLSPWPANSPDLNPIENVWGIMMQRLAGRSFSSEDSYWRAICKAWDSISYKTIRRLYDSIPARYEAVIDASGWPTKY